jgi:dephospho-CoA kinase
LHPLIGAQALRQAAAANGSAVVFDVPLLAESSHWRMRCHRIAVVDCTVQTQVHRVTLRSGWSPEQVRSVIAQQAARSARRAVADAVIYNDNLSLAQLQAHARSLWRLWAT